MLNIRYFTLKCVNIQKIFLKYIPRISFQNVLKLKVAGWKILPSPIESVKNEKNGKKLYMFHHRFCFQILMMADSLRNIK